LTLGKGAGFYGVRAGNFNGQSNKMIVELIVNQIFTKPHRNERELKEYPF
jgi:hypothetical protein